MKYLILAVTSILLGLHYAEGRPDQALPHHPPMVSQHETVVYMSTTSNGSETNTSQEATVDSAESAEEDNITVQAKTAPMCPPRQPEILEIERECLTEDKLKDPESTSTAPTTEKDDLEIVNLTTENPMTENPTIEAEEITTTPMATTDYTPVMETTMKPTRRHRKRTCNYHLCILRRLDVLDSSDMPDKQLLTNWVTSNITDIKQNERMQERLKECIISLQDIFEESEESSEEETTTTGFRRKKSCTAAKKVVGCLSKSTECPVLKF